MGSVVELPTIRRLEGEIDGVRGSLAMANERIDTLGALVGHLVALLIDRRVLSTSDLAILIDGVPKLTRAVTCGGANVLAEVEYIASDFRLPDKGLTDNSYHAWAQRSRELGEAAQAAWPS